LDAEIHLMGYRQTQSIFNGDELIFRGYSLTGLISASLHGNAARTGIVIQEGDVVVAMVILVINGFVVENERTYFCGPPNDTKMTAYSTALATNKVDMDKIKIGNRVSDIENASHKVIVNANLAVWGNLCHRTGHGLGFLGHEWPINMAFENRMLMKE